jgi:hypothetical protein
MGTLVVLGIVWSRTGGDTPTGLRLLVLAVGGVSAVQVAQLLIPGLRSLELLPDGFAECTFFLFRRFRRWDDTFGFVSNS